MEDLAKLFLLCLFIGLLSLLVHLDDITDWIVLHKLQIISCTVIIVSLAILILWLDYKRNKAIELRDQKRALEREQLENEKRKIWREEDIKQALYVGIKTIDSWHKLLPLFWRE